MSEPQGVEQPSASVPALIAVGAEMDVPGMFNLRDLGGLPVRGGGTVRRGLLLRCGELSGLETAGFAALAELGLRTVVDLRTVTEVDVRPNPTGLGDIGVVVHTIPLISLTYEEIPHRQVDLYTYLADSCTLEAASVVKALAAPGALPGLFHCAVGKDRTGFIAALVLSVIGVPDDEIIADFLRSNAALGLPRQPGALSAAARRVAEASPVYDMLLSARNAISAELISASLGRVRERHGSVADYLRFGGVTDEESASLEAALVEPGPDDRQD
ncbi:MAG TPA: tyrosine-protein phosphatase [Actinocrinis sp.]|nr:tyrosine-protein phosphatase [Actinocrinis sp.]